MPDPTRKTVSATQVSALLGCNPYLTRWLLWRNFKHGDEADVTASGRMLWGTRMQPVILAAVAEEMNLEVAHNDDDQYFRNDLLRMGCTPDGTIYDLNRGPGAVECKNSDWMAWRDTWTETDAPDQIAEPADPAELAEEITGRRLVTISGKGVADYLVLVPASFVDIRLPAAASTRVSSNSSLRMSPSPRPIVSLNSMVRANAWGSASP